MSKFVPSMNLIDTDEIIISGVPSAIWWDELKIIDSDDFVEYQCNAITKNDKKCKVIYRFTKEFIKDIEKTHPNVYSIDNILPFDDDYINRIVFCD